MKGVQRRRLRVLLPGQKSIPLTLRASAWWRRVWAWMRFRTTRRLHVLSLGLTPGWYDTDERMLYANFRLLEEFVEQEMGVDKLTRMVQDYESEIREIEQGTLYAERSDWGRQEEISWRAKQLGNAREVLHLYRWWRRYRQEREEGAREASSNTEKSMLHRLVEVRDWLWY